MSPWLSVLLFIASAIVGYLLIKNVPSLLHTPLMSGMNTLSGVTVVGALASLAGALALGSTLLAGLAIICAMINIVGGFCVTDRMLAMFRRKDGKDNE
ncbi:MAG: NAD(P) transhydrogenase subunit alpha [Clostridia bacterium]|nr:NAD(P) transhydrogenase subunit alpha [Clostridia bacterium]